MGAREQEPIVLGKDFENANVKTVKVNATGDTYNPTKDNPTMLPVPQPLLISQFRVPKKDIRTGKTELRTYMPERELKLLFFLLHAAWDNLESEAEYEVDVLKAYNVLKREYGINENTTTWIWDSAASLVGTTIRWTEIHGDERFKAIATLLTYAMTNEDDRKTGVLKFQFNKKLIPILKEPSRFTKLRLHFLMSLSGRYAILLYGILEGYANYDHINTFTLDLETIRSWLKIADDKLSKYYDLKRRVLEPAFEQINKNPEGAGFSVSYKPIKRGRKVHAIEITINKTAERAQLEEKMKEKKKPKRSSGPKKYSTIPIPNDERLHNFVRSNLRKIGKENEDINFLIGHFDMPFREYIFKKGLTDTIEDVQASFAGFIVKAALREKLI